MGKKKVCFGYGMSVGPVGFNYFQKFIKNMYFLKKIF